MPKVDNSFTLPEALNLIGRHVRVVKEVGGVPAGCSGEVESYGPYRGGYVVFVNFRDSPAGILGRSLGFYRDLYAEFLVEC